METTTLKTRRDNLANLLNNGDMILIFAAEEPRGISKFLQNNNFLYLTGLYNTPDAVYSCYKQKDKVHETLYIQRNIPEMVVWDGAKLYPDEAQEISGIKSVKFLDEFENNVFTPLNISDKLYINSGMQLFNKPLTKVLHFVKTIRERMFHLSIVEANKLMTQLRIIKDATEIEYLKKAIEITGIGLDSILKNAKVGMYEYELEAMLFYEIRRRGLDQFGFAPIIATGVNAATLHYKQNNSVIKENELVLCDVGALYKNYSADITRTFPISGSFTDRQAAIYNEVLNVQKTIIDMIKPGVGMTELNNKTAELIGDACVRLKLIEDPKEYKKYYMHSVGHHLGMDTHDLGARDSILEAGMVITVEPGIYIPDESIGVRIEDDILVTTDVHEILSAMIS